MNQLSFLVIDAYQLSARNELNQYGASNASNIYSQLLENLVDNLTIDVLYIADLENDLPTKKQLKKYHGIVWTGSSLTVYHDVPEVTRQIEFAKLVFEVGTPQFGSCWAAQVAITAAGGKCAAHPEGLEFGIARNITLTDAGRSHPMFYGKKSVFDAFISHYDEITHLPPGAQILAGNDFTRVQAVSVSYKNGEFWAPQYHPEYNLHELARLCYARRARLTELGFFSTEEQAQAFVIDLETLHENPQHKEIAWRLGFSSDLTRVEVRQAEARNWINLLVIPYALSSTV
jgi:GMP synthase (glutamine-hydrolysing)